MSRGEKPRPQRKPLLIFLLVAVPILFFLDWSQASLNLAFIRPRNAQEVILLLVVSAIIFLAFIIFALILARSLLKLYIERQQHRLGSRFKTKMVGAFLALSLVPVCFLFAFAYGLLNRSIDKWFGIPFDAVRKDSDEIVLEVEAQAEQRSRRLASHLVISPGLVRAVERGDHAAAAALLEHEVADSGSESAMCFDRKGRLLAVTGEPALGSESLNGLLPGSAAGPSPPEGIFLRRSSGTRLDFLSVLPLLDASKRRVGTVAALTKLPLRIKQTASDIQRETQKYDALSRERKAVKGTYLSMLGLLTLLILFVNTWLALFLSKQVTVPIQALVNATHEVSKGNFGYQVSVSAADELGKLIQAFNEMTRQLMESRRTIEQATQDLHGVNRELEERGHTMETILENVPTGVISFDPQGRISQVNAPAARMVGSEKVKSARTLTDLFSTEDARSIARLLRRASRQGVGTRQMDMDLGGRRATVALTVSSIRARHGTGGSVLVLEDLTELLRAQKAAAWQEVARRIAHEIKNPLTPIQLCAERIRRLAARESSPGLPFHLQAAVAESASLIDREVNTLKTLVDEFTNFARFPVSKPVPSSLNAIVENALNVFDGRLDGVVVHRDLAADLPSVNADPEQMKRALVNLIDNAAEALEDAVSKEIWVRTHLDADRDVVELMVADSGPGIHAEDKERLFLPWFSTKSRGTGLGLAIVSRIVSEHEGWIRVEDNRPQGTRFIIELPVESRPPGESSL